MLKNLLTGFINLLHLRGMRVLVLSVDPLFRSYLCRALSALGHDAEAEPDGVGLLRAAAARAPDAVLLDLDPPESGVLGVCAVLRRTRPGVRLVAVTDYPESAVAARRSGLDGLLIKPFGLFQLRGVLPSF
jgi:DNA-binding response OmpR family regulator